MANRKSKHHVIFPAFSFEKILLLEQVRKKLGYAAYEVSFLLGKHDFFIRDAENPLKTTLIDSEDTCQLAKVFLIPINRITPPNTVVDDYQLEILKTKTEKRKDRFELCIKNAIPPQRNPIMIVEEDKQIDLPTELKLSDKITVRNFINRLYEDGFFNNTRTALEIFDECRKKENFDSDFHPRYMIRAINHYTNKKSGEPLLDKSRTNLFARRVFFKSVDFAIDDSKGDVSKYFLSLGLKTFRQAARWVKESPYRRNKDKNNALTVFVDQCGTCSTKHALLKKLADENGNTELRLMLGLFTMNAKNTPAIASILKKYSLEYIPEAHNYFRTYNYILDYTGIGINETKFELDILQEIEIRPDQITDFKVSYHKDYLAEWIKENKVVYTLDDLWKIREECIRAIMLSKLELNTERLLLRPFKKEDGAIMYALNDDHDVLQYTRDTQFANITAAEEFLATYDQYEKYAIGRMVVVLRETGDILGWCGLKYNPELDEYDVGYRFFKKYWGKGYATESAMAVMEDGFARLGIKHIVGRARVENSASIRVFDKLKMKFVKNFVEDGENWVLYEVTEDDR